MDKLRIAARAPAALCLASAAARAGFKTTVLTNGPSKQQWKAPPALLTAAAADLLTSSGATLASSAPLALSSTHAFTRTMTPLASERLEGEGAPLVVAAIDSVVDDLWAALPADVTVCDIADEADETTADVSIAIQPAECDLPDRAAEEADCFVFGGIAPTSSLRFVPFEERTWMEAVSESGMLFTAAHVDSTSIVWRAELFSRGEAASQMSIARLWPELRSMDARELLLHRSTLWPDYARELVNATPPQRLHHGLHARTARPLAMPCLGDAPAQSPSTMWLEEAAQCHSALAYIGEGGQLTAGSREQAEGRRGEKLLKIGRRSASLLTLRGRMPRAFDRFFAPIASKLFPRLSSIQSV